MTAVKSLSLPFQKYERNEVIRNKEETQFIQIFIPGRAEVNEIKCTHFSNFDISDALEKRKDLLLRYLERLKQPDFRITHGASDYVAGLF